ncbi:MAG: ABC transporter ATP-binding protein [Acidimicrobiia bacterium]
MVAATEVDERTLSTDQARQILRRLWSQLRPERTKVVLAFLCLAAQSACLLAGPFLVKTGIDSGLQANDVHTLDLVAVLYVLVTLGALAFARISIMLVARLGETFLRDLRTRTFRHLMDLGLDFFEREQTGRLVGRMTSDVDALQELVQQGLTSIVQNGLLFVGALVVIFVLSWQLALCVTIVVPPLYFATRWFRRESNIAFLDVRDRIGHNMSTLQEGLSGIRVVQAYGREAAFAGRFRETNEAQFDANMRTVKISVRYFPVVEMSGVIATAIIIGVGGFFADQGIVTVGTIAAFVLYLNNLFEPVQQLSQLYNTVQSAGAALDKLYGLVDVVPSITERPDARALPSRGAVDIAAVSFAYGATDVLSDVSMTIAPGERIALVGPTGAGKSTLAKLIARFYDPRVGAVSFGGVDLRDATLASLRERIVVVPQEGFLFAGTVFDNVRVARPDASDSDVRAAIANLGLEDRFEALPDGLDTEVRERGSRLSAGERQLVSLARAALVDPALLVLDEATSNLDPGTEQAVERAMETLTEGRTTVVVAHRLTTAARADRIGVVVGGVLAELGSHEELLALGGTYAGLFASWSASAGQSAA